jgi:hypothetical protein
MVAGLGADSAVLVEAGYSTVEIAALSMGGHGQP